MLVKVVKIISKACCAHMYMAGFAFNFSIEEAASCDRDDISSSKKEKTDARVGRENSEEHLSASSVLSSTDTLPDLVVKASKEHLVLPFHRELLDHVIPSKFQLSAARPHQPQILYVDASSVEHLAKSPHVRTPDSRSETSMFHPEAELLPLLELSNSCHSDLIPGLYEGGLKVWECAFDLVEYLAEAGIQFSGMRVLELGSGAGLPAIFTLIRGAKEVHFQDYNAEVINHVTIPSVLLNTVESASDNDIKFYSGDWSNLARLIPSGHYDIILTSETIYNPTSQPKLLASLKHLLRPEGGVAYVAAKSYYFGVGGCVSSFTKLVEKDGYFSVEKCHVIDCEISREILKLQPHKIPSPGSRC